MRTFERFTILYVEDDDGIRSINSRILKRMFREVYEAADGKEGYALYLQYRPHIVLTDIKMPKMDGIMLSKKIREEDTQTKIIVTTAFSDEEYLLEAVELNLERYLVKPLTKRNLLPALEKAVLSIQSDDRLYLSKEFYYDHHTEQFYFQDNVIVLNKKELLFLSLLAKNSGRVVSYLEIEQIVWEEEYMSLNSLRTTIGFLRKILPFNAVTNVSNMGYRLRVDKA
jgi:DNA-binding response OmpR family regulator